ncbi:cytochrome c biogenesis protein ResB [Bacteroides fragilis]|uniref:cytochrome c biogenesis protein ResB n=1 Tax=Bacteroides fragilis TaxID=817 RepID=UPI002030FE31|nr:cytochrome c biogenesis protein ResB [Bacteroides fragilis]MCM0264435.1 cytochrome c biogenesis protein ResB [Bacteroides fragilis]
MWQKPWGYKEGFAICGGLFLTGIFLQMTLGKCTLSILSYPVNVCVGLLYVVILLSAYTFSQKSYFIRWMGSCQAAVSSMVSVAVLTVVMGLIRQVKSDIPLSGIENWLGFSQMLSACSFVLLFLWMVTLLGLTTIRRIHHFHWRDVPFVLNHLGLFLALTGAVLGNADMERLHMTTKIGQAEWRASDENQKMRELPLAIELQNFTIDEYPPKLMLIDNETGKALPVGKPENLLIEDDFRAGHLLDWEIHIEKKLLLAASVATQDTLNFVDFPSMGAAYAVYLTAVNDKTGRKHEGWVSCGSFMFPYKAIRLDDQTSLVMPEREPRRFASEVKVYTESGRHDSATIEVNKPFELEGWKIYQLSYDESKGRWSDISVFELVRDPWLPVVYTGIWMMIAGAVCLFALSQKRKEDNV